MLNKEKYKDEIFEIACTGKQVVFSNDGKPLPCSGANCQICGCDDGFCACSNIERHFVDWCNSEYKEEIK